MVAISFRFNFDNWWFACQLQKDIEKLQKMI